MANRERVIDNLTANPTGQVIVDVGTTHTDHGEPQQDIGVGADLGVSNVPNFHGTDASKYYGTHGVLVTRSPFPPVQSIAPHGDWAGWSFTAAVQHSTGFAGSGEVSRILSASLSAWLRRAILRAI